MSTFYKNLQSAKNEKDVENYYREYFNAQLKKLAKKDANIALITSPYKTDGVLKYQNKEKKVNINCLFEFKHDVDFNNKIDRTRVIIQALYYLKKFELAGEFFMPTTLFIGDKNECFYFHTNNIIKYLGYSLDWKLAPSEAGFKNDELLKEMIQDTNLEQIYIIDIDENFNFGDILKHINEISINTVSKLRITTKNVQIILNNFLKKVLDDKKLSVNDEVNLFIQTLVDRKNNYQHPNKPNVLVTKGFGDVKIKGTGYKSFINFFDVELSPSEKETLTATQDRLIQDETRRMKGEFFTPTYFVNLAHEYISNVFGEDWKEKYVVWDCASGTGNLTRDYKFKELYCSTLNSSDIETMEQSDYNPDATKFQYDFLNDGIIDNKVDVENDNKLPKGLKNAILEGKEIIFFMNPPYGTSKSSKGGNLKVSKDGIADTNINKLMLINDLGLSARQLYCQFLYRINKLKNINKNISICLFSPPSFLISSSYEPFRKDFLLSFKFDNGYMIDASNFSDVSSWPLSFSIFVDNNNIIQNSFKFDIKDTINFNEYEICTKELYSITKDAKASEWVKIKSKLKIIYPNLSSSLKIKNTNHTISVDNYLGTFCNGCNNVEKNEDECALLSAPYSGNIGVDINDTNFLRVVSLFTARKSITDTNWKTHKDEYFIPIVENGKYAQFQNDAIIYSLFDTHSNQSSMRQVEYKDKLWNIKNEFFFMSKDEMKQLAEDYKFDELYKDARQSDERYVYNLLKTTNLSKDAKDILETARELVRKSFEWRKIMNESNTEYHLHAWDAGWYQIKKVLTEHFPNELKEFNSKYKAFEDRLRPQVYELGFLKGEEVEVVE